MMLKKKFQVKDRQGIRLGVLIGDYSENQGLVGTTYNGQEVFYVEDLQPDPAELLAKARAKASMPRAAFILAALDAGILTETDAEQAVNGWPVGWDAFFEGQPARDRIAAKAEWASTTVVRRNAPLIAQLAAFKGLTDAQVDALFGITP